MLSKYTAVVCRSAAIVGNIVVVVLQPVKNVIFFFGRLGSERTSFEMWELLNLWYVVIKYREN